MLIRCPKCKSVYEISPDVLPESGRKMRCFECKHEFLCNRSDALVEQFMDLEKIVPEYEKHKAAEFNSVKNDKITEEIKKTTQIDRKSVV